jgi:hypothetical protein
VFSVESEICEKSDEYVEPLESYQGSLIHTTPPSEWFKFCVLVKRSFLQLYRDCLSGVHLSDARRTQM